MAKKQLTQEQAENLLIEISENDEWGDELYSLIHDKFTESVADIERENEIIDDDGNPVNSGDVSEDGTEWYDSVHDVFIQSAFESIKKFLNK